MPTLKNPRFRYDPGKAEGAAEAIRLCTVQNEVEPWSYTPEGLPKCSDVLFASPSGFFCGELQPLLPSSQAGLLA
jgi:hypothetical protein